MFGRIRTHNRGYGLVAFEEYWDFKLKKWVRGPKERDRIARDHGLVHADEWKDPNDILELAERNRKENMHKTYDGYDEAVARALYREENGYSDWQERLARDIKEADAKNEYKRVPLDRDEPDQHD